MYDLENHKYLTMYIMVIINFVSNPKRSCAIPMIENVRMGAKYILYFDVFIIVCTGLTWVED